MMYNRIVDTCFRGQWYIEGFCFNVGCLNEIVVQPRKITHQEQFYRVVDSWFDAVTLSVLYGCARVHHLVHDET